MPVFTGQLPAFQTGAASPLPPFAMWPAFPTSDYYGCSAPSRRPRRTLRLACTPNGASATPERFPRSLPFGRWGGAQLFPCGPAATITQPVVADPERPGVAAARSRRHPANLGLPRTAVPTHIHRVRAGVSRLRGFDHWFTCITPIHLACRARTVRRFPHVTSLSGLLSPSPAAPGSGCPQLHRAAATAQRRGLTPRPNQQRLVAHLRVQEHVGVAAFQRPRAERVDVLVERLAHA